MSKTRQVQSGTFNKPEENQSSEHKSAFQMLKEAQEKFEQEKQEAISQIRQMVEDWAIDLKKDIFPEMVKTRKPYTRKAKNASASAEQTQQPTTEGQKQPQEVLKPETEGVATSVAA